MNASFSAEVIGFASVCTQSFCHLLRLIEVIIVFGVIDYSGTDLIIEKIVSLSIRSDVR